MDEEVLIPPVKVGDLVEKQPVIGTGEKKGDGVVKYLNYIIFIEGCEEGQTIDFEVIKVLPKFGIARLAKIYKEDEE